MESKFKYEKAIKLLRIHESDINKDITSSGYSNSLKCLKGKIEQIDTLRNDIMSLNNIYSIQILFRSLIEHFLIGFYVYLKLRINKNDDVGDEYYDYYANSEYLKQETYLIQIENLKNSRKESINVENLKMLHPHLNELTQNDLESYHYEGNKFANIKKIGKFLIENSDFEPKLKGVTSNMVELLNQYNLLSSFVHGGPYAERDYNDSTEIEKIKSRMNIFDWVNALGTISVITLLLSLTYENPMKYQSLYQTAYKGEG